MKQLTEQQKSLSRSAAAYTDQSVQKIVNKYIRQYHGTSEDKETVLASIRAWKECGWTYAPFRKGIKSNNPNIFEIYIEKTTRAIVKDKLPSTRDLPVRHSKVPFFEQVVSAAIQKGYIRADAYGDILRLGRSVETRQGDLLEEYVWKKGQPYGLIWLKGKGVKASDFMFQSDGELLQVKNGATTENSSSTGDRNEYGVEKWFHLDSDRQPRWQVLVAMIQKHTTKSVPKDLFDETEFVEFCVNSVVEHMVMDDEM